MPNHVPIRNVSSGGAAMGQIGSVIEIAADESKPVRKRAWVLALALMALVVGGGMALVAGDDQASRVTIQTQP
jgi:hypothetical protein